MVMTINYQMPMLIILKLLLFVHYLVAQNITELYHSKYEYKFSFKGPYITNANKIPFWNHFYDTVPSEAQVRIAPSLRAKHGSVWTKNNFPYNEWQIEVSLRVTGKPMMGADGLALWYVETPFQAGPVFGSMDRWRGLGILFDSFDNNNKRDNPYISIVVNDGTTSYNHATDGLEQIEQGCQIDFRNRPYPVKAKIIYANEVVQVYIDYGNSMREYYDFCANMSNVILPRNYYFGVSAATGGVADDHDVLKFLTYSLRKKTAEEILGEASQKAAQRVNEELQKQYQKNLDEFQAAQQRFKEEHPDKVKEEHASPEDLFQGRTSDMAKSVFDVQSDVQHYINGLNELINVAIEKQDAILRSLQSGQPGQGEVAKQFEAENSLAIQRRMFQSVIKIQAEMEALKATALSLSNQITLVAAGRGANLGVGSMDASKFHEEQKRLLNIKEYLDLVDVEFKAVQKNQGGKAAASCPEISVPSCAPMSLFVGVAVAEVLLIVLYFACRQPSVDPGKKYF